MIAARISPRLRWGGTCASSGYNKNPGYEAFPQDSRPSYGPPYPLGRWSSDFFFLLPQVRVLFFMSFEICHSHGTNVHPKNIRVWAMGLCIAPIACHVSKPPTDPRSTVDFRPSIDRSKPVLMRCSAGSVQFQIPPGSMSYHRSRRLDGSHSAT